MPADKRAALERLAVFAPSFHIKGDFSTQLDALHRAIDTRHVVGFGYTDASGAASERRVWPLALAYWGARWTLGAWCELRRDFRNFSLEKMQNLQMLEPYPDQEGKRLADLMRHVNAKPR